MCYLLDDFFDEFAVIDLDAREVKRERLIADRRMMLFLTIWARRDDRPAPGIITERIPSMNPSAIVVMLQPYILFRVARWHLRSFVHVGRGLWSAIVGAAPSPVGGVFGASGIRLSLVPPVNSRIRSSTSSR